MTNQEIEKLARAYWADVPFQPKCPRNLENSVCWGHSVTVSTLPKLNLASVHDWLAKRGILRDSMPRNRPLHACLAAIRGQGFIFLNGTDPENEKRFSLAHEIAHFILDYELPRKNAIDFFGASIVDVLNGDRAPTIDERLAGTLRTLSLGNFDHLMHRDNSGLARSIRVIEAEDNADRLGLELLAPRADVMSHLKTNGNTGVTPALKEIVSLLTDIYALPDEVAEQYARFLSAKHLPKQSFRDWIGK